MHGGRQLMFAAHRRGAQASARRGACHAPGRDSGGDMSKTGFPAAARRELADTQMRRNVGNATSTIRARRAARVAEVPDWQELRDAGAAMKARVMATLPEQLQRLEASVMRAGGQVHWAGDAAECNEIVGEIAGRHGAREVIKVKSLATD